MKFTVAIFALFTTVAMAELQKVPRSQKAPRQAPAAQPDVATPAMTDAQGNIIGFNAASVYLDSMAKGM